MSTLPSNTAPLLAIHGGHPARAEPIDSGVTITPRIRERVNKLLDSGHLSSYYNGAWARRFEDEFATWHGNDSYAIAVNSGTSALHLAVCAACVGPEDEVIMPALCFVAAATAVVQNGGVPVVCDVEPDTLTLDPVAVERLITARTKAVLVVHFWGYPSNLVALRDLCQRHSLTLIEDCAQALGALVCGDKVGTFGDFATYAFSVRKHIACGEGGMVMCHSEDQREYLRQLSNYGKGPSWDDYYSLGFNYRMAEFPAIVAIDGLERLNDEIAARRAAANYYRKCFTDTALTVLPEPSWGQSVFFKCPMILPADMIDQRQRIVDAISAENVSCRVPHRPLFNIPWLENYLRNRNAYRGSADCPVTAAIHPRLFEIETGPHMSLSDVELTQHVVARVFDYFSRQ